MLKLMEKDLKDTRKWYQKKRFLIPAVLISLSLLSGAGGGDQSNSANTINSVVQPTTYRQIEPATAPSITETVSVEKKTTVKESPTPAAEPALSNDNYYTNVDDNQVHSPAYTSDNSVPNGASARCRDGTYSFSQNRRGTCSHHGGVSSWIY